MTVQKSRELSFCFQMTGIIQDVHKAQSGGIKKIAPKSHALYLHTDLKCWLKKKSRCARDEEEDLFRKIRQKERKTEIYPRRPQ